MSLSRSPSPRHGGGWSSPGLNTHSGSSSPRRGYGDYLSSPVGPGASGISWAAAKAKSDEVRGYPSFSTRNNGFFSRQRRKISASLPRWGTMSSYDYRDKEKLGRGQWTPHGGSFASRLRAVLAAALRKTRIQIALLLVIFLTLWLLFSTALVERYRRTSFGGGPKFVVILASNIGGGVMDLKGAREWAIERESIKNKKTYVKKWGYELEIVNMVTKKRYAHEWRESWEKVDMIRESLRKYPDAEWFWWLDLETYIMEPSYSLQSHLFNHLERRVYRDINVYNPLNITHPPSELYLDPMSLAATSDDNPKSINMIVPQDCDGFNLGSFFIRRSAWTDRLLDLWWDPVCYEQKHMQWEHKEQDAFEYLYSTQPWIRSHVAFIPQRTINSFPPGACGDEPIEGIHYNEAERDFLVNMAGCQFGRDCWGEMYNYRELSNKLNRSRLEKLKDGLQSLFGKKEENAEGEQKEESQ